MLKLSCIIQLKKKNMFRAQLKYRDTIIFDLHAEQVFMSIGSDSPIQKGVKITHLNNEPIDNLKKTSTSISEKNVIIDFSNILSIQNNLHNHFKTILEQLLSQNKNIYLTNLLKNVYLKLKLKNTLTELKIKGVELNNFNEIIVIKGNALEQSYNIFKENIFSSIFNDYLIRNSKNYNKTHSSSPVRLTKYIDIKGLIHEKTFFYYCIYKLAIKLRENFFIEDKTKKVFFCQTLNGAFIASFLAELLNMDIAFLDHIGPINKLYGPNLSNRIKLNTEYIIVSDVVCLGTELQVAKNIIEYRGGKYSGNVNVVRIKTLSDNKYENEFSLFLLSKENNLIDYKIEIDL